jgi:hypothetical protein
LPIFAAGRLGIFPNDPAMLAGFTALQLGFTIVLLGWTTRLLPSWRDPFLSLASSHHVAGLVLGMFLWIPIQIVLLSEIQNELGEALRRSAPLIIRDPTKGDFFVAVPRGGGLYSQLRNGKWIDEKRLEGFHRLGGKPGLEVVYDPQTPAIDRTRADADCRERLRESHWSWEGSARTLWDREFNVQVGSYWTSLWLDRSGGCLRLFAFGFGGMGPWFGPSSESAPPPTIPFERIIEKPAGRFSRSTMIIDAIVRRPSKSEEGVTYVAMVMDEVLPKCVVDSEDGSLWKLDPDFSSPLERLELPDGDRIVEVGVPFYGREFARVGRFQPWLDRCIRGERGYYEWNGSNLAPIDVSLPQVSSIPSDVAGSVVEIQTVYTDPDPLFPTVEERDTRTGTVLFTHRYAPVWFGDSLLAGPLQLVSILRPPLLDSIAYFQSTSEIPQFNQVLDPLLANRSRAWIIAASFLLSIGLTRIAMRRARDRGASPIVVGLSAFLVAAFGIAGFLMVWSLESRRSRRREARVEPRGEPIVLIETARAT